MVPPADSHMNESTVQSLRTILESIDTAIFVIENQSHTLLYSNQRAINLAKDFYDIDLTSASISNRGSTAAIEHLRRALSLSFINGDAYCLTAEGRKLEVQTIEIEWPQQGMSKVIMVRDMTQFYRMKDAMLDSEARLRATLDNAAHAIVLTDENGHFIRVNETWREMFGYTASEALELSYLDVTPPDFLDASKNKFTELISGRLPSYGLEKKYIRKNGDVFWGELSVTPVKVLDRRVGAAVGVIADISNRKKMEAELQESEALLRAIVGNLAQAVAVTDNAGRITQVNAAFEKMFGYTVEEARRLTNLDITYPDDIAESRKQLQALIKGDSDFYRIEKRYIRKDGSVFWGDLSCTPILNLDQRVAAAVAVIVDISAQKEAQKALQGAHDELERRVSERTQELARANKDLLDQIAKKNKAQEALKRSEERLRAIFETAIDCIYIKDRQLRYTLVNPAMEKLLEMPASQVRQSDDRDLFGKATGDYLHSLNKRVLAGEVIEAEHVRPVKGAPMKFLDVFAPMRNEQNDIIGICGISRNITERTEKKAPEVVQDHVRSSVMRSVISEARLAAGTDIILLLTGESGAGKDYMARYIHDYSRRCNGPFYTINCAAIPPELAESELFGHERGAFTGANRLKRGLLELAEGGTLLLNEIGELPQHLQAKLLTFLDERSFTRVGGEKPVTVSARLIAATNRDLEKDVAKNRFRLDLFYRLNVLSIRVPSLKERIEDLPGLIHRIIKDLKRDLQMDKAPFIFDDDMDKLCGYNWPGNIRELRNVLERALIVSHGNRLHFDFLAAETQTKAKSWNIQFPPTPSYNEAIDELKRNMLQEALNRTCGKKQAACRLLGLTRHMLRRQIERLELNESK